MVVKFTNLTWYDGWHMCRILPTYSEHSEHSEPYRDIPALRAGSECPAFSVHNVRKSTKVGTNARANEIQLDGHMQVFPVFSAAYVGYQVQKS